MCNETNSEKPHVLVIDDERGIRASVRFALDSFCRVSVAATVMEGLSILSEKGADTVVLDLNLPGINGIDGLREIRKIDKDVSVVILTAFGSLDTAMEAIRLGANDYQLKPFDVGPFSMIIREHIDKTLEARERSNATALQPNNIFPSDESDLTNLIRQTSQIIEAPLRAMGLQIQLIKHNLSHYANDPHSIAEAVQRKFNGVNHSLRISWEMLRSWLEADNGETPTYERIDLAELIRDVDNLLQPYCIESRVRFFVQQPQNPVEVNGIRVLLMGCLYLLMKNLVKQMDKGQELTFSWQQGGRQLNCMIHCQLAERPRNGLLPAKDRSYIESVLQHHDASLSTDCSADRFVTATVTLPAVCLSLEANSTARV